MLRPAKDAGQETEKQQEPQMAPKHKDAAAADETKKQIGQRYHIWHAKKADLIPGRKEFQPPRKILVKFRI
jgi:hypothetical protein